MRGTRVKALKWWFGQTFGRAPLKPGSPVELDGKVVYVKHDEFRMFKKANIKAYGAGA